MKKLILATLIIGATFVTMSCNHNKASNAVVLKADTSAVNTDSIIKVRHLVKYSQAKQDSTNFATYHVDVLKYKHDPFKYAKLRIMDMLECMGFLKATGKIVDAKNLGVIVYVGWDRKPHFIGDTVKYHLYLQPVRFTDDKRDSIQTCLFFNSHGHIVNGKGKTIFSEQDDPSSGDLYVADLNNPCPPTCPIETP